MKTITFLILSATVLVFFSCFGGDNNWATNQLGGIENASIIAKPVSVKAWRTVGSLKSDSISFSLPDYYQKSGNGKLVATNLAAQLSKVLLSKQSYPNYENSNFVFSKNCAPEPGVVVSFSNGKKDVDIFFCFECAILIVKANGKTTPDEWQSDFDSSRTKLIGIVKKIFPKDPQIQSLQARE